MDSVISSYANNTYLTMNAETIDNINIWGLVITSLTVFHENNAY